MQNDRDVSNITHKYAESNGTIKIIDMACPSRECPEFKGIVRADLYGGWVFKPLAEERTEVTRILRLDPKGKVPEMVKKKLGTKNQIRQIAKMCVS